MDALVYDFKRHGVVRTIIIHKISEIIDYKTGERVRNIITKRIRRAVVFPTKFARTKQLFGQDFKYGAQFDTKIQQFLIDVKDFDVEIKDYIIVLGANDKWEVVAIEQLNTALIISCKVVEGATREAVIELSIESYTPVTQTIGTT